MSQINSFPHHGLFSCSGENVYVYKEKRRGFFSEFHLKCKVCQVLHTVQSENPQSKLMNVNASAVTAIISTGGGYSALEEFSSALNIPPMSYTFYHSLEGEIQEILDEKVWQSMIESGKEEARLALENGETDGNGIPEIAVVADGAWSKRSYKTKYDANSGEACIIGYRTKKLLFLGVRNKFCAMCLHKDNITQHVCYKNWDKSSTAIESDIIVEGFCSSIKMHGIKYKYLIADGDSSVYRRICEKKPYGPNYLVIKVECKNHLLRNFCSRLRDLCLKRFSSSGKLVSVELRNYLRENITKLRTSVDCAVKYWKQQNLSDAEKINQVRLDIDNAPRHVFGCHKKCNIYFCKRQLVSESSILKRMQDCGMYSDITSCMNRLKFHAPSLIRYVTNNYAESFNSVVAKFVGGKRVNFAKRGSYEMRCNAAGLSFNERGMYHETLHHAITGRSAGIYTQRFAFKKYLRLTRLKLRSRRKLTIKKSNKTCVEPDQDYGTAEESIDPEEYEYRKNTFLKNLANDINNIHVKTLGQRDSSLWFSERRKRLTASNFGRIYKLLPKTDKMNVAKEILNSKFTGNIYTQYGIENEPKAIEAFASMINKKIESCGLFINPVYPYLAASPDGLIGSNYIVEIKCPFVARNMEPETAIREKKIKFAIVDENNQMTLKKSHKYYSQIQGQLFITEKECCYFIVWTPKGLLYQKIGRDQEYWSDMLPKLKTFYFDYLLKELLKEEDI